MGSISRDNNFVPAIFGVSSVDGETPTLIKVNPATGAMLIDGDSLGSIGITPATKTVATLLSGYKADYYTLGTSDEDLIQTTLDAIKLLGGGKLFIKKGLYTWTTNTLLIPSNITIEFEKGASIKAANGYPVNINMIQNDEDGGSNSNINLINLSIDGNYSNRSGTVSNSDEMAHNIMLRNTSYSYINNLTSQNSYGAGFCLAVGSYNNTIENCSVLNGRFHNFLIVGHDDGTAVYENTFTNCFSVNAGLGGSGAGFEFAKYALSNSIIGCHATGSAEGGLHFFYRSNKNSVIGGSYNSNNAGIHLVDESDNNIIEGVTIDGATTVGIGSTIAFLPRGGYKAILKNNIIINCGENAIRAPIFTGSKISGNIIDSCGNTGTSTLKHGLYIGASTNLNISNNTITNSADIGIYLTDISSSHVDKNISSSNIGRGIFFDYSSLGLLNTSVGGNITEDNGGSGISALKGIIQSNFIGNTSNANNGAGLDFRGASFCEVSLNTLTNNTTFGLNVSDDAVGTPTTYCDFSNNQVTLNTLGGIRELGSPLHNRYVNNNSTGNTTADFSVKSTSTVITNGSAISVSGGLNGLSGVLTDTASQSARGVFHSISMTPPSNSSSQFVGYELNNLWNPSTGITQNSLSAIKGQNRVRGDGLITSAIGIIGDGFIADSSSAATIQATNVTGFDSRIWGRPSGTSIATIGTGIGFDTTNLAPTVGLTITNLTGFRMVNPAANTITNLVGMDIAALTRGATNIGLRIAAPSSGATANYALQLSDTGGVAAGGITYGTDTSLYRTSAGVLAVAGNVTAKIGGSIFDHFVDAGNTHTDGVTFDDLYTDTLPINTFNVNGDKVNARYSGIFVSSATATREIKVLFAGTTILDTGALTTATAESWDITVMLIRVSSTVVRCVATIIASTTAGVSAFNDTTYTEVTSLTLSNTNIIKIIGVAGGTGAAASDIVAKLGSVAFAPAA